MAGADGLFIVEGFMYGSCEIIGGGYWKIWFMSFSEEEGQHGWMFIFFIQHTYRQSSIESCNVNRRGIERKNYGI